MKDRQFIKDDRIGALASALVGAGILFGASKLEWYGGDKLGPAFFFYVIGIAMIVLSLILFLMTLNPKAKQSKSIEEEGEQFTDSRTEAETKEHQIKFWLLFFSMLVFVFLIDKIGFILSAILFLGFNLWQYKAPGRIIGIMYSILFPVALYLIFRVALGILLPSLFL